MTNFSWLVPGVLAGLAHPGGPAYEPGGDQEDLYESLRFLRQQGIGAIVSLTESSPDPAVLEECGFEHLWTPVADMIPPSIDDITQFVYFVDSAAHGELGVGVHCLAGLGRTGTMLACYLVSKGDEASEAIARVRRERPGSIETLAQEEMVYEYGRRTREMLDQKA